MQLRIQQSRKNISRIERDWFSTVLQAVGHPSPREDRQEILQWKVVDHILEFKSHSLPHSLSFLETVVILLQFFWATVIQMLLFHGKIVQIHHPKSRLKANHLRKCLMIASAPEAPNEAAVPNEVHRDLALLPPCWIVSHKQMKTNPTSPQEFNPQICVKLILDFFGSISRFLIFFVF